MFQYTGDAKSTFDQFVDRDVWITDRWYPVKGFRHPDGKKAYWFINSRDILWIAVTDYFKLEIEYWYLKQSGELSLQSTVRCNYRDFRQTVRDGLNRGTLVSGDEPEPDF